MIDIVHFDDWVAVYKNGEIAFQDHSIDPEELLNILDVEYSSRWIDDWDYCEDIPSKLEDYD